jgi:hypothetical protein
MGRQMARSSGVGRGGGQLNGKPNIRNVPVPRNERMLPLPTRAEATRLSAREIDIALVSFVLSYF